MASTKDILTRLAAGELLGIKNLSELHALSDADLKHPAVNLLAQYNIRSGVVITTLRSSPDNSSQSQTIATSLDKLKPLTHAKQVYTNFSEQAVTLDKKANEADRAQAAVATEYKKERATVLEVASQAIKHFKDTVKGTTSAAASSQPKESLSQLHSRIENISNIETRLMQILHEKSALKGQYDHLYNQIYMVIPDKDRIGLPTPTPETQTLTR